MMFIYQTPGQFIAVNASFFSLPLARFPESAHFVNGLKRPGASLLLQCCFYHCLLVDHLLALFNA